VNDLGVHRRRVCHQLFRRRDHLEHFRPVSPARLVEERRDGFVKLRMLIGA
jgi:hypothetical protein